VIVSTEMELHLLNTAGWSIPPAAAPLGIDAAQFDDVEPATRAELGAPADGRLIACAYD
jgi:hypothetical protein